MGIEVEKDESQVEKVVERVENLQDKSLEIGIFGEDDSELLMIATVNEYGIEIDVTEAMRNYLHAVGLHLSNDTNTINIPERRFIRGAFEQKKQEMMEQTQKLVEQYIYLQIDEEAFWSTLGQVLAGKVQEYMTELDSPPNHPFTIRQKGSSNPLIDSGRLRQAVTWKVR